MKNLNQVQELALEDLELVTGGRLPYGDSGDTDVQDVKTDPGWTPSGNK